MAREARDRGSSGASVDVAIVVVALLAAFLGHGFGPGLSPSPRCWGAVVRACLSVRGVEVLFMLLVPSLVTSGWRGSGEFLLTDLAALVAMIGGTLGLAALTWRAFGRLSGVDREPLDILVE